MLAEVAPPDGADEWLIVQWGGLRALNLFINCGRVEPARQVLADVKDRVDSEAVVGLVKALDVSFKVLLGDVATAIETGPSLCGSDVLPLAALWRAVATSFSAPPLVGWFGDVHRIADAGLRAAALRQSGSDRFNIGLAESTAFTWAGNFPAAERVWERFAAMTAGVPEAEAMVYAMLGVVQLGRGALTSACSAFHDSISAMSRGFPSGWLMLVSAWARAGQGSRGDRAAAAAALRRSEAAYGPQVAVFLPELELARAWQRACVGQTSVAYLTSVARAPAQIARQSGMCTPSSVRAHAAVRLDDRSQTQRLAELAETLNTPMAEAIAEQARGLADQDGDVLDAAADRFVDMGAVALAADAAAQAARDHARTAPAWQGSKVFEPRALVGQPARNTNTGSRDGRALSLPITAREREIVMLARGWFVQPPDRRSTGCLGADGGGTRSSHLRQARHRAPRPAHPLSTSRLARNLNRAPGIRFDLGVACPAVQLVGCLYLFVPPCLAVPPCRRAVT